MQFQTILLAAVSSALLSACSASIGGGDEAAGQDSRDGVRSFAVSGFTGVELGGSDNVVVKQGNSFSVVATGPQNVLDKLEVVVDGATLVVRRKSSVMGWTTDKGSATVTVTMPALTDVVVAGSGNLSADRAAASNVSATLAGSGDLTIAAVEAQSLKLTLAGSGDLAIRGGKAANGTINHAGSGDINAAGLTFTDAKVSLAGSGDIAITATGAVKASLIGSGDVNVGGGAKCDSNAIGSGEISCG